MILMMLSELEKFNLRNVSVQDRLTTQIHECDLINGGSYIRMGATTNRTSIEALQKLEALQRYNKYHGFKNQMLEYQNQLIKEIQAGIVIETDNIRIFNSTILVRKPGEKQRKILDCRNINQLASLLQFKMDGIKFINQILEPSDFATTLDLQNAYHHIRVSDQHHSYFSFAFMGKTFAYIGLSFGYRNSPYIFNKTILLAIRVIRKRRTSLKVSNQINDIILIHKSKTKLMRITLEVIDFLKQLAMVFDIDGGIDATREKKIDQTLIMKQIQAAKRLQIIQLNDLSGLIGELNFLRFKLQNASLNLNSSNLLKCQAIRKGFQNCKVKLTRRILNNLYQWLILVCENRPRKLLKLPQTATVTTDVAGSGWGSTLVTLNLKLMDAGKWSNNWLLIKCTLWLLVEL
ncbi:MAG: hypothetical protein EZS28_013388, partial [Streblomastix strix]